jgi:hypothetical protein
MSKKLLMAAVVSVGLLGLSRSAFALNYASANLNVTVNGDLSMSIVGSADTTFPAIAPGASSISGSAIVVLNDSVGIVETFTLKSFDSDPWTLQNVPGNNQFALQALFNTVAPATGDFAVPADSLNLLDKSAQTNGGLGSFEGDQSGAAVMPGSQRSLWFQFQSPTTTTSFGSRVLTVSIVAGL